MFGLIQSVFFRQTLHKYCKRKQLGFVASYMLYAIALLGVIGVAYGKMSNAADQQKNIQETTADLVSQIEIIRSKLLLCAAQYPDGDHGEFAARRPYPAPPAAAAHQDELNDVTCPGSPSGSYTLAMLSDGTPMPVAPPDFDPWVYEHTELNGIRLILSPKQANGALQIRTRLIRQMGSLASLKGDDVVVSVLN